MEDVSMLLVDVVDAVPETDDTESVRELSVRGAMAERLKFNTMIIMSSWRRKPRAGVM
jgi:hypothetical protein